MQILGIDVGASGIKGAPVDTVKGEMLAERCRIPTPQPATPKAIAKTIAEIVKHFEWEGPIGCGFPGVVQRGIVKTASNVHDKWLETDAVELLSEATGCPVAVINDADAAGLAEMKFGVGQGRKGVVLIITIGTGLGTALFSDGHLLPNTELGHIEIRGKDAEKRASDVARQKKGMSWEKWAELFDEYLCTMHKLFWPDLIILGGGGSKNKKYKKYADLLTVKTEVVPATMRNAAGIVGAALAWQPENDNAAPAAIPGEDTA